MFNWRGQFTPEFVEYILDSFASQTDTAFDPFCGSGTVILESARRNMTSVGFEINPAAYAMARFITLAKLPRDQRRDICESLSDRVKSLVGTYRDLPLFDTDLSHRKRYKNLIQFAKDLLAQTEERDEVIVALNALFHAEKTGRGDLASTINRSLNIIRSNFLALPGGTNGLEAHLCDARLAHQRIGSNIDLILTSPPYINVFNYHQNYRAIMEVLGFDLLKVAASEIGSNRKNRGNRFRTVVQYALEMEQALCSFARTLKSQGLLILVVGRESRVRGVPFLNAEILYEVAHSLGCYSKEIIQERVFTNRFGKTIREDVLVLRNANRQLTPGDARSIAAEHLRKALTSASGDVADDITEVLTHLDTIQPSPLFDKKGII